jgi:ABC-2 type transport system permease protein
MYHRLILPTFSIAHREVIRFIRQPFRIVGALGTPVLFWLLIGSGVGRSFQAPQGADIPFIHYFLPGALLLLVLFTSIFSAISIIVDRNEGFMQSVIPAPIPRITIVLGKAFGAVILALGQAILFGLLSYYAGGFPWSVSMILPALAILALSAFILALLGFATAWPMDSVQGYHGIMNLVLMPAWLLSGAVFPPEGAFAPLRTIMMLNPLHYAMSALRHIMLPETHPAPSILICVLILLGSAFVLLLISEYVCRCHSPK